MRATLTVEDDVARELKAKTRQIRRTLKEVVNDASACLTTDLHPVTLAIEHRAEPCSNDADFARFPGPRRRNPLD